MINKVYLRLSVEMFKKYASNQSKLSKKYKKLTNNLLI